jgi:hypothetical protein
MKTITALAAGALAAALAGCASTPPQARVAKAAEETAGCVRDTGTRIRGTRVPCAAGRVYTAEQIRNTGALSVDDALEQLGAD